MSKIPFPSTSENSPQPSQAFAIDEQLVRSLENEIKSCNYSIEDDKEEGLQDPNPYYLKAVALVKLSNIYSNQPTQNKALEYKTLALEAFDKAVEYSHYKKGLYLIERSKLHVLMGNNDLAVEDMVRVAKLGESGVPLEKIYIKNTLRDISTLDDIKDSISKLSKEGKITSELAKVLESHAQITSHLVVRVDSHEGIISNHQEDISELKSKIESLESIIDSLKQNHNLTASQLESLNITTKDILIKTKEQEEIIHDHSQALILQQEQIKKIDTRLSLTEESIRDITEKLALTDQELSIISRELEAMGITTKEFEEILPSLYDLKDNLEEIIKAQTQKQLEIEQNNIASSSFFREIRQDLYKSIFYNTIIRELNSTYLAASVVSTNSAIVANSKTGNMGKIGSVIQTLGTYIPTFGGAVSFFGSILSSVDNIQQKRLVANFAKIATSAGNMEQISNKIAFELTKDSFDKSSLDNKEDKIIQKIISSLTSLIGVVIDSSLSSSLNIDTSSLESATLSLGESAFTNTLSARLQEEAIDTIDKVTSSNQAQTINQIQTQVQTKLKTPNKIYSKFKKFFNNKKTQDVNTQDINIPPINNIEVSLSSETDSLYEASKTKDQIQTKTQTITKTKTPNNKAISPETKGVNHANLISKLIISEIFKGNITLSINQETISNIEIANKLIIFVFTSFGQNPPLLSKDENIESLHNIESTIKAEKLQPIREADAIDQDAKKDQNQTQTNQLKQALTIETNPGPDHKFPKALIEPEKEAAFYEPHAQTRSIKKSTKTPSNADNIEEKSVINYAQIIYDNALLNTLSQELSKNSNLLKEIADTYNPKLFAAILDLSDQNPEIAANLASSIEENGLMNVIDNLFAPPSYPNQALLEHHISDAKKIKEANDINEFAHQDLKLQENTSDLEIIGSIQIKDEFS